LPIMGEGVAVRPDQVALRVLVAAVLREVVRRRGGELRDGAKRSDGKLPAPVMTYLTMAMCLFAQGNYTGSRGGVAGTRTGPVPTASGITHADKRRGPKGVGRGVPALMSSPLRIASAGRDQQRPAQDLPP
jgi:hypothetical protein